SFYHCCYTSFICHVPLLFFFYFIITSPQPQTTLFPYTTLFRAKRFSNSNRNDYNISEYKKEPLQPRNPSFCFLQLFHSSSHLTFFLFIQSYHIDTILSMLPPYLFVAMHFFSGSWCDEPLFMTMTARM